MSSTEGGDQAPGVRSAEVAATSALRSFTHWFDETLEPAAKSFPLQVAGWRNELEQIRLQLAAPERQRIALVGTTGAGKSTFLNAVLGQQILPVGVMQPCTAFVTAVSAWEKPNYQVDVEFVTRKEWEQEVATLVASLRSGESETGDDDPGENKRLVNAALKRIQAVYGSDADPAAAEQAQLPPPVATLFQSGSTQSNLFDDAKAMSAHLKALIRGNSALWPLVKQVTIQGPYNTLPRGLELVDLPGLNDPNEARVQVTREYLRTSPFVWVLFSMVRGLTEDIQRILHEERLLRTLVLSGTYGGLTLVGTKADDIDVNIADQLGLPEDCDQSELIRAYCEQTITEARNQLEQMVRDLASPGDNSETLSRMIAAAREVRVHTTSSNAFNKLTGVGQLKKDYGLSVESETGIPAVRDHLNDIARNVGGAFRARSAVERLNHLRDEIAFFFRAQAQLPNPNVESTRVRFAAEHKAFSHEIQQSRNGADAQLKAARDRFLATIEPLCAASISGVVRVADSWRSIHWASLRATVTHDGMFKSPSSGRLFDLNRDVAEPLLNQLPVSWERFFTEDLGGISSEFVLRVTVAGKNFCERLRLINDLVFGVAGAAFDEQLNWFESKMGLLARTSQTKILAAVRERRSELAGKMPNVAQANMRPGYDASKGESGTGMKQRILDRIVPRAHASARPIYSTIQTDLLEGLTDLEAVVTGMFRDLTRAAEDQARIIAHNANLGLSTSERDPRFDRVLESIPGKIEPPAYGTT